MAIATSASPLVEVLRLGQSIWYDNIRRGLISSGELARLIAEDGLRGVTSNPSIWEKAIDGSTDYAEAIAAIPAGEARDAKAVYEALAIRDIQDAADALRPVYKGGPNSGVFLQITCEDAVDLPVPEQQLSFGVVKAAQARGDLAVLAERGRRALRIHLHDADAGLALLRETVASILDNERNL